MLDSSASARATPLPPSPSRPALREAAKAPRGAPVPVLTPRSWTTSALVRGARERDGSSGIPVGDRIPAEQLGRDGVLLECTGCGCRAFVTDDATACAACGWTRTHRHRAGGWVVRPSGVLPFDVDQAAARSAIARWAAARWLAPRALRAQARRIAPRAVWLPYWCLDSKTLTHYRGQRGHDGSSSSSPSDSGPWRPRSTSRTRWRPVTGSVRMTFDDVLVCASRSLPSALVERLGPWDLSALRDYEPSALRGGTIERYGVEPHEGLQIANSRMEREIRDRIRDDIGGELQRIHDVQVTHADVCFQHLLMPLWIAVLRVKGESIRVLVDARTGAVVGERTWSRTKLSVVATLGALALLLAVLGLLG